MIRLEGVAVRVGGFALGEIGFEIPNGGYGLVIGPTGSGKTTLLEAIAGHLPLRAGRILLRDRDVSRAAPEERRIGFVYQQYHLFPHRSVEENIGYGLRGQVAGSRSAITATESAPAFQQMEAFSRVMPPIATNGNEVKSLPSR